MAKYHLGRVKLELMQPASVPIQLISFRQVRLDPMQPAISRLTVRDLRGGSQGICNASLACERAQVRAQARAA